MREGILFLRQPAITPHPCAFVYHPCEVARINAIFARVKTRPILSHGYARLPAASAWYLGGQPCGY